MNIENAQPNNTGANVVNTSDEVVNAEFDAIANDLGIDHDTTKNDDIGEPDLSVSIEDQVKIGREMIGGAIVLGFNGIGGYGVDEKPCLDFAENLSVVICKYYPGGYLALLEKYKEELALGMSGYMLAQAVIIAARAKAAKAEQAEKKQPEQTDTPPAKKSGFFNKPKKAA